VEIVEEAVTAGRQRPNADGYLASPVTTFFTRKVLLSNSAGVASRFFSTIVRGCPAGACGSAGLNRWNGRALLARRFSLRRYDSYTDRPPAKGAKYHLVQADPVPPHQNSYSNRSRARWREK
jgi:hypothetical protein